MADFEVNNPGLGFPLNAVVGGIGSAVGGLLQNAANRKMAKDQMKFQERMSSTAWQRAVVDMKKAGLNPMLAFQQGGASSPGGASASMADVVGAGTHSARAGLEQRMQLRLMGEQMANVNADTWLKRSQNETETERKLLVEMQKEQQALQNEVVRQTMPKLAIQSDLWKRGQGILNLTDRLGGLSFGGAEKRPGWPEAAGPESWGANAAKALRRWFTDLRRNRR